MLMAQPDAVLCKLAARGNANAYEVLFERYRQPVFAFVFHLLGRSDGVQDCEDIVQDSFAKAFAGIRDKNVEGSFRAWIYTIARNRTFDLIRARRSNVHSLDAATTEQPQAAEHTETDKHAEQRLELTWLVGAVAQLPERQRDALLMRELGGMSHDQIATQMGTTISATKKLIGRGREAVTTAAANDGYRSRNLGRDLALAAPVVPLAAASIGFGVAGGAALASGGSLGGAAFGGKTVAAVMAIVAVGGGAVAVDHERSSSSKGDQIALAATSDAAANAVAGDDSDRRGGRGRGELPLFGVIDDRRGRSESGDSGRGRGSDDDRLDDNGGRGRDDGSEDDRRPRPERDSADDRTSGSNKGPGGGGSGDDIREPRPDRIEDDSGSGSGGHGGGSGELRPDDDGGSNSGSGSSGSGSGSGGGSDD